MNDTTSLPPSEKSGTLTNSEGEKPEKKIPQTDLIFACVKDKITLYKCNARAYAGIRVNDCVQIVSIESVKFKDFLSIEYSKEFGHFPHTCNLKEVIYQFLARARYSGMKCSLDFRIAKKDKHSLYYDLGTDDGRGVIITPNEWKVATITEPLFVRSDTTMEQVLPEKCSDLNHLYSIFKYINVNPSDRLLVLVYIISLFIQGFPHPLLLIHGSRWASKSTFSLLLKKLFDPGTTGLSWIPDKFDDLMHIFNNAQFVAFDNLSNISNDCSNALCRAVSWDAVLKRKLFKDEDCITYHFRRSICINGINAVANRPDLLDRSIIVEMERIDENNRKTEDEFWDGFKKELPKFLGCIFDILAKVVAMDNVKIAGRLPRMADFAQYGYKIAEALGGRGDEFLKDYAANETKRNDFVLEDDIIAQLVVVFLKKYNHFDPSWKGTPTQFYTKLKEVADFEKQSFYYPKTVSLLMRRLNEVKINLQEIGINYTYERLHAGKNIIITNAGTTFKENETDDIPF